MKKTLITLFCAGISITSQAQYVTDKIDAADKAVKELSGLKPKAIQGEFIGFRNPESDDLIWQPILSKVSRNESEDDELLERIKEEKAILRASGQPIPEAHQKTTAIPPSPILSTNFSGINNSGFYTPLDNTLAISDKDTIVAFVNAQVGYYNTAGLSFFSRSIYTLINDPSVSNNLCDPKIIWDNTARRFIFYTQVCDAISANSKIILGFSKTSNPKDGWYFYKFSGNPLSNGMWWDYPKLAVSAFDVFVTGNLFSEATTSFSESVILQVQKSTAYSGTAPASQIWSGLSGVFSILPIGYGQSGSFGPGIYAVSTGGASPGRTNVQVMNITNKIGGTPAAVLNTYDVTVPSFSTAGNAPQQLAPKPLNTGDSRAQDGFYLKGNIHFVHNVDAGGGYCGLRYYRIKTSTMTAGATTYGNISPLSTATDCAYPAIGSSSNDSNDQSVLVAYNEVGNTVYPRTSVVACDQSGTWSAPVVVKAGASYVTTAGNTDPSERWGDYTGMCKRFGDPANAVWMAGMYGSSSHNWLQWIAKIAPKTVAVPTFSVDEPAAKVFPNPVVDKYSLQFKLNERQNIIINLTDMMGRTVVELYNGMVESGENNFSFNKQSLANGIYSLNIIGANTNIRNEKIVIAGR